MRDDGEPWRPPGRNTQASYVQADGKVNSVSLPRTQKEILRKIAKARGYSALSPLLRVIVGDTPAGHRGAKVRAWIKEHAHEAEPF